MSGIQISGLLSNQAFDWKSIVDQLIAADSGPITALTAEKTTNTDKSTALDTLKTALTDLQDSVQAIRAGNVFSARNVSSDTVGTTWNSNSANGATVGTYKFAVTQLATKASTAGATDIGSGLSATSDVAGLTIANLPVATAVTAGTFTVNGQPVNLALTDSLADVFGKISTATSGHVAASYDPVADGITLTSDTGSLVLGAANDTSNFFQAMKVANNGTPTTGSSAALGTVKLTSPLASSGLRGAITAVDSSGNGSVTVNGVAIAYNINTDSLSSILSRVNQSSAGVNASYDSTSDRVVFANKTTGDVGLGLNEATGGLLGALGITTGSTFTAGKNALFTVNGGAVLSSASNTLDAATHGVTGLSVTVNSETTQTVSVDSDTASMQTSIQDFIDKFNTVQDLIDQDTQVTVSGSSVSAALLSDNREIQSWASHLRSMAFDSIGGLTGSVQRLDNLGIDFDSTTGHLAIKDADKLATSLADHPDDVQSFFLAPSTGMVSQFFTYLTNIIGNDSSQQAALTKSNTDIDAQIATLQSRLDDERQTLTDSFTRMLDAQSAAQSQQTYLTNTFFKSSSSS